MKPLFASAFILVVALCLASDNISGPKLVGEGVISTTDDEAGFAMTPDGKTAFFGKTSPSTAGDPMHVICIAHLNSAGRWAAPEISSFSGEYHDLGPALTPTGSRLETQARGIIDEAIPKSTTSISGTSIDPHRVGVRLGPSALP